MKRYNLHSMFCLPTVDQKEHSLAFADACATIVKIDRIDEIYNLHACFPNVSRRLTSKSLMMRLKTCAFLLEFWLLGGNYIWEFLDEFAKFLMISDNQADAIYQVLDRLPESPSVTADGYEAWVTAEFHDFKIQGWTLYLLTVYFIKSFKLKHHQTLIKFIKNFG